MAIARTPMIKAESKKDLKSWRWGSLSLASWAAVIYWLMIVAFALPRLLAGSVSFPIYKPHEYVDGSYPLFWLVYIWIPLFCRDIYVARKLQQPFSNELKAFTALVLLASLVSYKFVFGWF